MFHLCMYLEVTTISSFRNMHLNQALSPFKQWHIWKHKLSLNLVSFSRIRKNSSYIRKDVIIKFEFHIFSVQKNKDYTFHGL